LNLRAYINGNDGVASVTQAAAVHVVPIYNLRTVFSFPFKQQTVIGASSSSHNDGYFGLTCRRIFTLIRMVLLRLFP
jgi:hypothetical protein